ncbi:MAG: Fe-S cluster assembly protein SufD [Arenimonas sp.]
MTALLESLQTAFTDLAPSKLALEYAIANGLPGPRNEQWKYTSLRALSTRRFSAPPVSLAALDHATTEAIAAISAPRIVFVNGIFDAANSALTDLPNGMSIQSDVTSHTDNDLRFTNSHEFFTKLNTAVSRHGVQINIDKNTNVSGNVNAVFVSVKTEQDLAIHLRHKIVLGENAKLDVIEHHIAQNAHQHLVNHLCEITLEKGAQLFHARIQQDDLGASHFLRTEGSLQSNAGYHRLDLELGSHLSRHDLQVKLLGDGAVVNANGSLIAGGRRHVDTRLDIQHIAKNTSCNLFWRGLATDRGRAVFHGGILIEKGADGAAAHLSNKNLLLSDNAEIDTQPVLVIHADEVAASHGATVGRLDAGHLFYLRARGIPEAQAKAMLTNAFCKETLKVLADEKLINIVAPHLEKMLQTIEVQE